MAYIDNSLDILGSNGVRVLYLRDREASGYAGFRLRIFQEFLYTVSIRIFEGHFSNRERCPVLFIPVFFLSSVSAGWRRVCGLSEKEIRNYFSIWPDAWSRLFAAAFA